VRLSGAYVLQSGGRRDGFYADGIYLPVIPRMQATNLTSQREVPLELGRGLSLPASRKGNQAGHSGESERRYAHEPHVPRRIHLPHSTRHDRARPTACADASDPERALMRRPMAAD